MTAYLIVRAEVDPSVKSQFDTWYQAFHAVTAKRGWSSVDPHVHIAFYEFPDLDAANTLLDSETMKGFIKEFDLHWVGKVVRSRELVEFSQAI